MIPLSSPDGREMIRGEVSGNVLEAEALGASLADDLLSRGADRILQELYKDS